MGTIELRTNPEVAAVFAKYPDRVRAKMMALRELILETARELPGIKTVEETLKWGEPSYLTKHGSTLRMDWKSKKPGQYAVYFKCTSRLVETFRILYKDKFHFEGDRAIVFQLEDRVPEKELKECIKATLTYHRVKQLPTLGL